MLIARIAENRKKEKQTNKHREKPTKIESQDKIKVRLERNVAKK